MDFYPLSDQNLLRLLRISGGSYENHPIWWRLPNDAEPDPNRLAFYVTCSDFFIWGSADLEEITDDDLDLLESSLNDAREAVETTTPGWSAADFTDGFLLYCSRRRNLRPQGACYPHLHEATWPLFDAAGAERETDYFNPRPRPADTVSAAEPSTSAEPRPEHIDECVYLPQTNVDGSPVPLLPEHELLSAAQMRRLLMACSWDETDRLRWWSDPSGHIRFYLTGFAITGKYSAHAAEIGSSDVDALIAMLENECGIVNGTDVRLRAFVNDPNADAATPADMPTSDVIEVTARWVAARLGIQPE